MFRRDENFEKMQGNMVMQFDRDTQNQGTWSPKRLLFFGSRLIF
jgi:AAA+ superfamily predicted ATPase